MKIVYETRNTGNRRFMCDEGEYFLGGPDLVILLVIDLKCLLDFIHDDFQRLMETKIIELPSVCIETVLKNLLSPFLAAVEIRLILLALFSVRQKFMVRP